MSNYAILPSQDPSGSINVAFGDSANLDPFSRLRVSTPVGLFDSTFQYDLQPTLFYAVTANSGTIVHAPAVAGATLSTAASAGSSAILQSKTYHRYIPGKGQFVLMTGNLGAGVAGIVKRVGYFDASDGIFYEQNGTDGLRMVRRTNVTGTPTDNVVERADWNIDPLDGSGRSGVTLNPANVYILVIEMQWLGMGRVRVGFDIDGRIYPVHQFLNANKLTTVYMKTANLPVRWEIAGNGVASMNATCSAVVSEGGVEYDRGYPFSHASGTITAASGVRTPIVSIRPAATFNSITNRIQIQPVAFNGLTLGNNPVLWEIVYNGAITGGAWVAEDATLSGVEYNITPASIANGTDIDAFYGPATASSIGGAGIEAAVTRLPITLDTAGANPITLTLCATGIGGTSDVRGSITWKELR